MPKKTSYFDFLEELAFDDTHHKDLALYLYGIPFEWVMNRDENRMYDGIAMRREFDEAVYGKSFEFRSNTKKHFDICSKLEGDSCTMLEFFVGFAYRLVRDMFNNGDISVHELIKMWFENLDIFKFDGKLSKEDKEDISEALDIWVDRLYHVDGSNGGIFVIPNPPSNLRNTELWVQASWWYNYYFT